MATNDPSNPWPQTVQPPQPTGPWAPGATPTWPPPPTTGRTEETNDVQESDRDRLRYADEAREARRRDFLERSRRGSATRQVARVIGFGVLIVAVAAGAAYAVSSRMDKTYAARTQLQILLPTDGSAESASRSLVSEALAVRSRSILQRTAAAAGMSTDELERRVKSRVLADSEIIQVDVEDHDPATALAVLKQLLDDYLSQAFPQEDSRANAFIAAQIAALDQQVTAIDQRLAAIPAGTNSRESLQLGSDRTNLVARRDSLIQSSIEMTVRKLSSTEARVLTEPYVLSDPVSPSPIRFAVLAAAAAGVLALSMAYLVLRRPVLR